MRVTIKDVAEYAEVAVSTVSRVINNQDRVSSETRERVLSAIRTLGYVKNNLAASIKTGKTRFIVVVVPEIRNEFYSAVIQGAESVISKKGYFSLVYTTDETYSKEQAVFEGELNHLIDGIILTPSQSDFNLYSNNSKPMVFIDRIVPESKVPSICVDNYKGIRLLMDELFNHGHKKIAIIVGPLQFNIGIDRLRAYKDALSEKNIPLRQEYIRTGEWFEEDGYRLTERLLELSDPPTAIVATNNLLGIGCAECIYDKKLIIGKDISIVSFDDSVVARYLSPGITCIKRPTYEMGVIGANLLLEMIEEKDMEIANKVLDITLVKRGSIADV